MTDRKLFVMFVQTISYRGADSDEYLHTTKLVPTPNGVSADSDYGFTLTYMDSDGKIMSEEKTIKADYEYSRDTYYELIEKGRESLDLMIEVARESEHPRAFEVLSNMIKGIADVNDKLMDLNKKNKDINKEEVIKDATTCD